MLVWLFHETRMLYIFQALKIIVVNINNCFKKTITFLMGWLFWYSLTTIPLAQTLHRVMLSPLLLLWNCLMNYHPLWYSSSSPLWMLHQILQRLWNLAVYKTIVLFVNSCGDKHKPKDWLNSFNGTTYWSFKNPPSCYQNIKYIFDCMPSPGTFVIENLLWVI